MSINHLIYAQLIKLNITKTKFGFNYFSEDYCVIDCSTTFFGEINYCGDGYISYGDHYGGGMEMRYWNPYCELGSPYMFSLENDECNL